MATVLPTWPELKALEASMVEHEPDPADLLRSVLGRPEWHERAACRGDGPAKFFPTRGRVQTDSAKALCARCPVRSECRDFALADAELAGVWGGTSEPERRHLRRGLVAAQASRAAPRAGR